MVQDSPGHVTVYDKSIAADGYQAIGNGRALISIGTRYAQCCRLGNIHTMVSFIRSNGITNEYLSSIAYASAG